MKRLLLLTVLAISCLAGISISKPRADQPETVMVTFHAKAGAETELARVIAAHWKTVTDLKLVATSPHLTLRGTDESGKTYFVEIFTWRDSSIPDAAPPAIQKIWAEMNALVESRGGRPGLTFTEVSVIK
jgi:hypothetical protein